MTLDDIQEKLIVIVKENFNNTHLESIHLELTMYNLLLDSMDVIDFALVIEKEFNTSFDNLDILQLGYSHITLNHLSKNIYNLINGYSIQ